MSASRIAGRSFNIMYGGRPHSFQAGERVPGEIVELVKNPKVWEARGEIIEDTGSVTDVALPEAPEAEDEEIETFEKSDEGVGNDAEPVANLEATLDSLTVKQLLQLAEEMGVDKTGLTKKADLKAAIKAHGAL